MYMPDRKYARHVIDVGEHGTLLVFDTYNPADCPVGDPYREILIGLSEHGRHRNLFLIDRDGRPVWRIADYGPHIPKLPDRIVGIRPPAEPNGPPIAVTLNGDVLAVNLADGTTKQIGWEK